MTSPHESKEWVRRFNEKQRSGKAASQLSVDRRNGSRQTRLRFVRADSDSAKNDERLNSRRKSVLAVVSDSTSDSDLSIVEVKTRGGSKLAPVTVSSRRDSMADTRKFMISDDDEEDAFAVQDEESINGLQVPSPSVIYRKKSPEAVQEPASSGSAHRLQSGVEREQRLARKRNQNQLQTLLRKRQTKTSSRRGSRLNEEESSESSEYESFIKSEDSGESSDVSLDPMPIIDELDAPDRKLVELTQKNRELKAKKQLVKTPKTPRRLAIHDSSSESDKEEDVPSDEQSSSASQSERTDESDEESTTPEKKKRRPDKPLPLDYTIFGWNLPLTSWFPVVLQLIASEWMEPGFIESAIEQQDEYFMPPWLKMIDILQRKKDTLVSSQLWSSEFKKDLQRYPCIQLKDIVSEFGCEACRRSNRISTYSLILSEKRDLRFYQGPRGKLEPDLDSSGEDRSDESTSKRKKRRICNKKHLKSVSYAVGRFCAARCQLFHQLEHYPYQIALQIRKDLLQLIQANAFSPLKLDNRESEQLLLESLDAEEKSRVVRMFLDDSQFAQTYLRKWKELSEQSEVYCTEG